MTTEQWELIRKWSDVERSFKPGHEVPGIGILECRGFTQGVSVWWLKGQGGCISVPNLVGWLVAREQDAERQRTAQGGVG